MRIDLPVRRGGRGGARGPGRPLAALPMVPAGSYLLTTTRHGGGDGLLMVGVGNDQFAIVTQPLAAFDGGLRIDLPAGARALTIRGDEVARDQLDAIQMRPLDLDFARRDARPGAARRPLRRQPSRSSWTIGRLRSRRDSGSQARARRGSCWRPTVAAGRCRCCCATRRWRTR